jgi:hypothetical protein
MVRLIKTGRYLIMFSLFMIMMLHGFSAAALNTEADKRKHAEYEIKAAYLYNFAKFVEWPAETFTDPSLPFGICIIGEDPFGDTLDTIKGKNVKGKKLEIRQYAGNSELKECHILFISPSEKKNLADILEMTKDRHILTVSDMNKFADHGGMIFMNKAKNKIRLEINHEAAKHSGLKMSSKLLKIAKIVKGKN